MTATAIQTPIRQAALNRAMSLVGTGWSHKGRGQGSYQTFDWVGLLREAVIAATNDTDLADLADYTPESITVEQAEDLMLSWGLRRIPTKEAREGDIVIVSADNYGKTEVFGGIISQNHAGVEQKNKKPYGKMVSARHCVSPKFFFLLADKRATASAFRIG
jgi:hypothetical protein